MDLAKVTGLGVVSTAGDLQEVIYHRQHYIWWMNCKLAISCKLTISCSHIVSAVPGHSGLEGWTGRVLRRVTCAVSRRLQKASEAGGCIQVGTTVACPWNQGRDHEVGIDFESRCNKDSAL